LWSCQRHWALTMCKIPRSEPQIQSVDRWLLEILGEPPDFEGE
jgi:hypothetical protein